MARARSFRGRSGAPRKTSWLEIPPTLTTLTGGGGTIVASLTTAEKAKLPFTIVRTHLYWDLTSDQSVASEYQMVALGGLVVSQVAETVGVSAVPTPVNEAESDFFFIHSYLSSIFTFKSGVGIDQRIAHNWIESKAMRKVSEDEDVLFVVELANAIASGATVALAGRMLIKEH